MALNQSGAAVISQHGWSPTDSIPIINMTLTGDAAYPAGGYPSFKDFVAQKLERGLERIISVYGIGIGGGAGYHVSYDGANDKLLVHAGATALEIAPGDISTVVFNLTIFAR